MKKLILLFLSIFIVLLTSSCDLLSSEGDFVPAPPPYDANNVMNIQQLKIADGQIMNITSPVIDVVYRENGEGAGATATEIITLQKGEKGTMLSVKWGDWEKASLELVNYYGPDGELTSAMIVGKFDEISLFQLISGHARYTIDRSDVILIYTQNDGELRLSQVQYAEKWGPGSRELAYGGYAIWDDDFEALLPPAYLSWGFWESNGTPAQQVSDMLKAAMRKNVEPVFQAVDLDGGREVIGRQTGLVLTSEGEDYGEVIFTYSNTWGRQPNTNLISSGALSLIEWVLGDTTYYMIVLSPRISPVGNSLYIFTDNRETAYELSAQSYARNPSVLYDSLRRGTYDGVLLSLYAIGDIGAVYQSSGDSVTHVGDSGGVQWRSLGPVEYENIEIVRTLLAILGPAQYQTGLYYAYQPGSGSGLSYYVAALSLMYADEQIALKEYSTDVGVLDRVLIPELDFLIH